MHFLGSESETVYSLGSESGTEYCLGSESGTEYCLGSESGTVSAALMGFVAELQKYCGITTPDFILTHALVLGILDKYNGDSQVHSSTT